MSESHKFLIGDRVKFGLQEVEGEILSIDRVKNTAKVLIGEIIVTRSMADLKQALREA